MTYLLRALDWGIVGLFYLHLALTRIAMDRERPRA